MTAVDHPAPQRQNAPLIGQVFGLTAGPVAWGLQLVAGYALSGHACFPGDHPVAAIIPGWGWTRGVCVAINLAALAVCAGAGAYSLHLYRATEQEAQGGAETVVDIGVGRTRFSSLCGALTSFGFMLMTLFNTVIILGAPACRG